MRAFITTALTLAALCSTAVLANLMAGTSQAATAASGNLQVIRVDEDAFRNYDFDTTRVSRNGVDWPVDFIFYNNASINRVKNAMRGFMPYSGGTKHGRVDDGSGPVWDGDKGIKDRRCTAFGQSDFHTRLYAPPSTDRLFNRTWGYYIIGTAHIDHNECWFGTWFGRSEEAEAGISAYARDVFGPTRVLRNHRFMGNREPLRREGNHIWQNDGNATFVRVR